MLTLAILSGLTIPAIAIAVVIAMVVVGLVVASRYKTVPPNAIGVFYGRKYVTKDGVERGFKIVTGGGKLLIPVIERFKLMSVEAFQIAIEEAGIPTAKNVPVKIIAVATCRLSQNPDEQYNAVQAFLDKDGHAISETVHHILRGHVRSIIAKLSVEQILRDRNEFSKQVHEESSQEFKRLGIEIVNLVVQDVSDENGYIKALGQQETAGVIRDAAIATANADKETKIQVSNAQRDAAEVAAQNDAKQAEAIKKRDIQVAAFKTETETARAKADLANAIAKTSEEQTLRKAEAQRDAVAAEANIAVQEKQAVLTQKKLEATVIVEAEAQRKAALIKADAAEQVAQRTARQIETEANGRAAATIKDGEAQATRTRTIASAEAEATQATQLAHAKGVEANALATARGTEANLLATANGKKAALLAEAEGTEKLNAALANMSDSAKLIFILERLPNLLDKGGDAGSKMLASIFTPLGNSLGAIKNVSIVDMGGSDSKGGVARFAGSIPEAIAGMVAKAEALGVDVKPLLKLLKLDTSKLQEMIGLVDTVIPADEIPAKKKA